MLRKSKTMTKNTIIVGTRGSKLALWQTEYVVNELKKLLPNILFDIKIIKTKGDKILDSPLHKIGDKGLFTKELEESITSLEIDMAVHSMKDLPTQLPEGLLIGAVLKRFNPQDALISKNKILLKDLKHGSIIGTSSLRRKAQIKAFNRTFIFKDLRGNVDTRLRKLNEGEFDAIILATAGLEHLGMIDYITEKISFDISLPAVGQGAIGVQIRDNDEKLKEILNAISHEKTYKEVRAERSFLKILEGGCQVPMGAYAILENNLLKIRGFISDTEGENIKRGYMEKDCFDPEKVGEELARSLMYK